MNINFINDIYPKGIRAGFSVFCQSIELQNLIEKNFEKMPVVAEPLPLSEIAYTNLSAKGINIPCTDGYVHKPVYVIAFRDSFLAVPLRMVRFIAATYQEIYHQAETYSDCPRDQLVASVTASMKMYAGTLGYFNLDFRIGDSLDFTMVAGAYAVHFDFTNLVLEVMENQRRHIGTIDYIIHDFYGEENDRSKCSC